MPSAVPGLVRCSSRVDGRCGGRASAHQRCWTGATFAKPKSRILACPRLVTKMLAGLMSRWTIPSACAASSASAISMASDRMISISSGLPADAVLQGHAFQKLHGDEGWPSCFADLVDRADVGMVQSGSGLRFALKALEGLRVVGYIVGQELQGDEAAELGVLGLVDDAHAAAAELFDDAVVRDGLADHGWIGPWQEC